MDAHRLLDPHDVEVDWRLPFSFDLLILSNKRFLPRSGPRKEENYGLDWLGHHREQLEEKVMFGL